MRVRSAELDEFGVIRSKVFPGLWLNVDAFIASDLRQVYETLQAGIERIHIRNLLQGYGMRLE